MSIMIGDNAVVLLKFVSIRVPRRYSDDASRRAVLYPFLGPVDLSRGDYFTELDKKTHTLIRMWRERLDELKGADWVISKKPAQFAVCKNCCPSLMVMHPSSLVCKQQSICPFCYARGVQDLYRTVSTVCKSIPGHSKADYWLLGYRQVLISSRAGECIRPLQQLFEEEKNERLKAYKLLSPLGGYVGTEFEPVADNRWKITRRGILLTRSSVDLTVMSSTRQVKRIKKLGRGDKLAKLIGWTMRYPKRLLEHGDPHRVVKLLSDRKSNRLNASYGLFRKKL